VSPVRLTVLLLGPFLILASCLALCSPRPDPEQAAFVARVHAAEQTAAQHDAVDDRRLASQCSSILRDLQDELPGFTCLSRSPFVLAGTPDAGQLAEIHDRTVLPVARALWRAYCDRRPDQPITIVVVSDEAEYRDVAQKLDGYHVGAYSAYYNRAARRIVLRLSSGPGTLAHELTHALIQFDFPDLPEWLDEGLASLQEETSFTDDGLLLVPESNWRSHLLKQAVESGQCPSLEGLVKTQSFRGEGEGLHYAYVRCLCLYLHERNLLSHFYRKFRANVHRDPSGLKTLCELLDAPNCQAIDLNFQTWVEKRLSSSSRHGVDREVK